MAYVCWIPILVAALVASDRVLPPGAGPADSPVPHEHVPVELDGTPIVSRVPMAVERPRRLLFDPAGNLLVVDAGAGTVVRWSPEGMAETVVSGLDEPAALVLSTDGDLYIANHAGGQTGRGSIARVSPDGRRSLVASNLTGPTALAWDARGVLHVALFEADEIATIDRNGQAQSFAANVPEPAGLAFTEDGELLVVSSGPGTLSRISPAGDVRVLVRGLEFPTDVAIDSRGRAIVAQHGGDELLAIDREGRATPFAAVPPGTIALALDGDDNPCLANWDFRLVMRMTIHLWIPCPHCDMRIPVRIRSRDEGPERNVL